MIEIFSSEDILQERPNIFKQGQFCQLVLQQHFDRISLN